MMSKFLHFALQSIMVSVSFIDCGNYVSNMVAGAQFQYTLLFVIVISNLVAILFQSLCVKLGSVTGNDLAQMCGKNMPPTLKWALYIVTELAIIATDLAGVVGTAVALNILFNIRLSVGVMLTILDTVAILVFYNPEKSMARVRSFEIGVSILVGATVVCFAALLCKITIRDKSALFRGLLPSTRLVEHDVLYASCALVGATVMPHALFLGSALVQARLRHYDEKVGGDSGDSGDSGDNNSISNTPTGAHDPNNGNTSIENNPNNAIINTDINDNYPKSPKKPSVNAINYCLNISYLELTISLFAVSTFVNGAMLVVAGSSLYGTPEDADLQSIYGLLQQHVSQGAATIFVVSLLFSGQASGIATTIAGQIVSEGFVNWRLEPWMRRLVTRLMAIVPCLLVTSSSGVNSVLNASQVFLSLVLPFCSAPLIYFTGSKKYMMRYDDNNSLLGTKDFTNSTSLNYLAWLAWAVVGILNLGFVWGLSGEQQKAL